jgi:hypothetical protein
MSRPVLSAFALSILLATACAPAAPPTTSLRFARESKTPRDASVIIDEEYIGPLFWVAARGVRVRSGTHRITVERDGYFPYDVAIVAGRSPVRLDVRLVPVPD